MAPAASAGQAGRIASVAGWQLSTQTRHTVAAKIFADCSGDAVLAPLSGAEFRLGREAQSEFGESLGPRQADAFSMGMTLMYEARDLGRPQPFTPPAWAHTFESCEDLPGGAAGHRRFQAGYWWIELGGEEDSIHDSEVLRDELLRIVYGAWDHKKNHCPHGKRAAANYALDWVEMVPGRRESRRYIGDHVLNQNDVQSGGTFDDLVAYGGWEMDEHHPKGFHTGRIKEQATLLLDTGLDHDVTMSRYYKGDGPLTMPPMVLKAFRLEGLSGGEWRTLHTVTDNHHRLVRLDVEQQVEGVRLRIDETFGAEETRVYGFYLD